MAWFGIWIRGMAKGVAELIPEVSGSRDAAEAAVPHSDRSEESAEQGGDRAPVGALGDAQAGAGESTTTPSHRTIHRTSHRTSHRR